MTTTLRHRRPNTPRFLFAALAWAALLIGELTPVLVNAQGVVPEEPEDHPTPKPYTGGLLQFNGLYQSEGQLVPELKTKSVAFLRFYQDGTVLAVTSSGSAEPVSKWLDKDKAGYFSRGAYKVEANKLSFTTYSATGSVEYSGEIIGTTLKLSSVSRINNNRATRVFTFAPLWK